MDFRKLDYVITVAQERTLLAAAEKLYLSPSALSQYISRLEDELQTPLFKRTKSGWEPTRAGQIYIDMAQAVLDRQKRAYLQINDIAENKVGHFTVGVNPGRGTMMFASVLPKFKEKYPSIKISLVEGTVLEISELINAGKVDIGFITNALNYPNVETRTQVKEDILMVVPRSHPMANLADQAPPGEFATVNLRQFEDDEFLLAGAGTTLRTLEDHMFAQAGFMPKIVFETSSISTLNMLSRGGYGPSFVPLFYAEKTDDAVYFRTKPAASWELVTAYRRDHYLTQAEEYMISLSTDYYISKRRR